MTTDPPKKRRKLSLWRRSKGPDFEATFLAHKALIERAALSACRRAGLPEHEAEEFAAQMLLKVVDNDYAVLRKHRGDSKMSTYLTMVVQNQFKDECNRKWGKFRHSKAALRMGAEAKALERLLEIDKHDLETAIEILRTNHKVETSPEELREMAAKFPRRTGSRRFESDEALIQEASPAPEADTERRVKDGERTDTSMRVEEALNLALETLNTRDLLLLKMFYRDSCTIAAIATILQMEARPLYSRKEKCLAKLRGALEARGLTWEQVQDILGWQGREIQARFDFKDESGSHVGEAPEDEDDDPNSGGKSV